MTPTMVNFKWPATINALLGRRLVITDGPNEYLCAGTFLGWRRDADDRDWFALVFEGFTVECPPSRHVFYRAEVLDD